MVRASPYPRLTAKGRADSLKEDVENFLLENKDLQG
jgi:hypothetical protein